MKKEKFKKLTRYYAPHKKLFWTDMFFAVLGAAIAVKPVSPQKLTVPPVPVNTVSHNGQAPARHIPKIATSPHQVGANTLLPQPPAPPVAPTPVAVPDPVQEAAPASSEPSTTP